MCVCFCPNPSIHSPTYCVEQCVKYMEIYTTGARLVCKSGPEQKEEIWEGMILVRGLRSLEGRGRNAEDLLTPAPKGGSARGARIR